MANGNHKEPPENQLKLNFWMIFWIWCGNNSGCNILTYVWCSNKFRKVWKCWHPCHPFRNFTYICISAHDCTCWLFIILFSQKSRTFLSFWFVFTVVYWTCKRWNGMSFFHFREKLKRITLENANLFILWIEKTLCTENPKQIDNAFVSSLTIWHCRWDDEDDAQ